MWHVRVGCCLIMKLAFAFLANAADFSRDGKFCVLGGDFDTLQGTSYPATHPSLSVVVKVILDLSECGKEHELTIGLVDCAGKQVTPNPVRMKFQTERDKSTRSSVPATFIGSIFGIPIPEPGEYAFVISVDGEPLGKLPLYATQVQTLDTVTKVE